MKRSLRKAYVIAFLCLISAATAINTTKPMPTYLQPQGTYYGINCTFIDIAQTIRSIALFTYYRAAYKKNDLNQAMCLIQDQIKEFETWLLQEEENALITIKNKYGMSEEIWQQCMTDIQKLKIVYSHGMQQPCSTVTHDSSIPADLLKILTTTLTKNGINPQSINLYMITDQEEIDHNTNNNARTPTWITAITADDGSSLTYTLEYRPSAIEIFPNINDLNNTQKIAICAHEVQHLIRHHTITKLVIARYLNYFYGIEIETFHESSEYYKLVQIHEAQAEILSAIANPEIAQHFKTYRSHAYYPGYLYEEHYYHLSTIDMLWTLNSWLEFFHHDGVNNIRNELVARIWSP